MSSERSERDDSVKAGANSLRARLTNKRKGNLPLNESNEELNNSLIE